MAFVRWRGNSATLLATVYEQGKSRQVLLATLGGGYSVPNYVREAVGARFPDVFVDWEKVNEAMAKGPRSAPPLTGVQLSYLEVEQRLRAWANQPITPYPDEARQLLHAAQVLTGCRAREGP